MQILFFIYKKLKPLLHQSTPIHISQFENEYPHFLHVHICPMLHTTKYPFSSLKYLYNIILYHDKDHFFHCTMHFSTEICLGHLFLKVKKKVLKNKKTNVWLLSLDNWQMNIILGPFKRLKSVIFPWVFFPSTSHFLETLGTY